MSDTRSLRQALDLRPGDTVALVGGGGKTTLMFALARELENGGEQVICTTTTKIMPPSKEEAGTLFLSPDDRQIIDFALQHLSPGQRVTLCRGGLADGKLDGLPPQLVDKLGQALPRAYIIVEADGSKGRPVKAPSPWEPVIPESSDLVVALAGVDGVGVRLDSEKVFRPEMVGRLTKLSPGDTLSVEAVARLFLDPAGLTKGAPERARLIAFINKVDLDTKLHSSRALAGLLLSDNDRGYQRVILGQLAKSPAVVEIITLENIRGDTHERSAQRINQYS
jgi:probable selenium-dependent hydroxylase accessory protein YqeC